MPAPAMRRWETALALLAIVVAAGALLPLLAYARLLCTAAAAAAIVILLAIRLRAHAPRGAPTDSGVDARIARIRAARGPRRR